jgi:hypothetical protein
MGLRGRSAGGAAIDLHLDMALTRALNAYSA